MSMIGHLVEYLEAALVVAVAQATQPPSRRPSSIGAGLLFTPVNELWRSRHPSGVGLVWFWLTRELGQGRIVATSLGKVVATARLEESALEDAAVPWQYIESVVETLFQLVERELRARGLGAVLGDEDLGCAGGGASGDGIAWDMQFPAPRASR